MKKKNKGLVYFISSVILLIGVVAAILFSCYSNTKANFDYISTFIEEFSGSTAKYAATVIKGHVSTVESSALLYGASLKKPEPDLDLLATLEANSDFRYVRFIAEDGTSYASDGTTVNVADRDYFERGMKEKSGLCYVSASRVNGEKLIGYYAPVYYENELLGLMVGFLSEADMGSILSSSMWNYTLESYVMDTNGVVVASNHISDERSPHNLEEALPAMNLDDRNQVLKAVMLEKEYPFFFGAFLNRSAGYVMPIDGTHWVLVEMIPHQVAFRLSSTALRDNLMILLAFAALIMLLGGFLVSHYRKDSKARAEEATNQKISSLMGILNEDYVLLSDIDLTTNEDTRYYVDSGELAGLWPENKGTYDDYITHFANTLVVDHDRERFLNTVSMANVKETLKTQKVFYVDYDVNINGQMRQFQSKYVMPDAQTYDHHLLISVRDVTELVAERMAKEKELREARNQADAANRAKTSFLFNMSHDIRTPMNAIVGFTNLLSDNLDNEEKAQNYIQKIQTANEFLLSLINNVLEMARIESGKMTLDDMPCQLHQFNDMLATVFEEQLKEKEITFTHTVQVTHDYVLCDVLKLKEIYLNILSNAIKYTPAKGRITMTFEELPDDREGFGLFKGVIADTGIGMSEDYLKHIFEEFSRETTTTDSKIMGTGLGMPIVKRLVDLMNGTISVESRLGEGTRVTILIPHRLTEQPVADDTAANDSLQSLDHFKGKRILLAEDNELNAEIACEILQDAGFILEWAMDGAACVEMLTSHPADYYDLILMDVQMPKMNGYDATKAIRAFGGAYETLPIIAMTANAFEEDKKNALAAGMNGHLAKPIEVGKLFEVLNQVLADS